MNWIDLIIVLVVLIGIIAGWRRGFILGTIDLLMWIGTFVLAYLFYPYSAKWLAKVFNLGPWLLPLAFLFTAIIARILLGILLGYIIRNVPDNANNNGVNRFLGIIPGAVNGWVYAVIVSVLLFSLPLRDTVNAETRSSRFAGKLAMEAEWVNRKLAPVFDDAIRQTLTSLTVRPGSEKNVGLSLKYDKAVARPDLETRMLEMVNAERTKHGLKPLQADPELTVVARAHSQDMFARGYFSHVSPDGKNPFDRIKEANISYRVAGENLAFARTLDIAHNGLMNSPGHRANILYTSFGRLGIGILDGGSYGLMISQEFRD